MFRRRNGGRRRVGGAALLSHQAQQVVDDPAGFLTHPLVWIGDRHLGHVSGDVDQAGGFGDPERRVAVGGSLVVEHLDQRFGRRVGLMVEQGGDGVSARTVGLLV